jgi:hypothetical protein
MDNGARLRPGVHFPRGIPNEEHDAGSGASHSVTAFDAAPVARFTYTCDNKASCTFDGRSSSDDFGIVNYAWQFGGIGNASGSVATVSFKHNSTQSVMLTVRDTAGQAGSISQIVKVR